MLAVTLVTCMNNTAGHKYAPKIHRPSITLVNGNGMQKQVMKRSARAKFTRYLVRSFLVWFQVRERQWQECYQPELGKSWACTGWWANVEQFPEQQGRPCNHCWSLGVRQHIVIGHCQIVEELFLIRVLHLWFCCIVLLMRNPGVIMF